MTDCENEDKVEGVYSTIISKCFPLFSLERQITIASVFGIILINPFFFLDK